MATEAVKVMVRVRPLNNRERDLGDNVIVGADRGRKEISITDPNEKDNRKLFTYDDVFPMECSQKAIYQASGFSIVENVLDGYNGTIFAYGQTGCGKTFSMMGDPRSETNKGIIPRTFSQIMNVVSEKKNCQFLVMVSFLEIYNENIRDLLGDPEARLDVKEDKDKGVFVQDLSKVPTKSVDEMLEVMFKGDKNRSVGATAMNQDSSRSHSIFTIYVEMSENLPGVVEPKIKAGKLNLVDLAGSERQSKTQATGQRLEEAKKINLSLSALGNVISALVAGGKKHIPYRDSKLTRLLQDSLGGNTKTLMIAAVSPAKSNFEETVGTLKYASRAKMIQNKPTVNEDPKDAMLKQLADELKLLQQQLQKGGMPVMPAATRGADRKDVEEKLGMLKEEERRKALIEAEEAALLADDEERESNLREAQRQRALLEQKLAQLKGAMVGGDKKNKPVISAEDAAQYAEMKKEVEAQQEEEELAKVRAAENAQKVGVITDNFEEMSEKYQLLQQRYKQMCRDVRDTQHEILKEKEELVDNIRFQERELGFLKQIITVVLSQDELEQIKEVSNYDDENEEWYIPKFELHEGKQPARRQAAPAAVSPPNEDQRPKAIRVIHREPEPKPQHKLGGGNSQFATFNDDQIEQDLLDGIILFNIR